MTLKYKTRGFIFKKNDVGDSDRVFSIFTDDFGRLDIFAKAIRKITSKLRGGIDSFFISEIEFVQGKNKKTLTDALAIKKFGSIYQDLETFKIAGRIGGVLDDFIKGEQADKEIFTLLNEVMEKLNGQEPIVKYQPLIFYYFLWSFLSLQGYHSEVKNCASCSDKLNPYNIYFSGKEGGIICKRCLNKNGPSLDCIQRINSDVVKILRIILQKDWKTLSKLKIELSSRKLLAEVSENAIKSFCP